MQIDSRSGASSARARTARAGLVGLVLALLGTACGGSGTERVPAASEGSAPGGRPASSAAPAAPAAPSDPQAPATSPTRVTVGRVAGRLGTRKRAVVKQAVTEVVDRYVEGAWTGAYPRTDFSAALVDFRTPARRDAERDLSLLSNLDLGAGLSAVSPTRRRLRIDVLAPRGRPSAATARLGLDLTQQGVTGETSTLRVRGSLLLSNQRGAWKVFGYDVRPEVLP